MLFGKENLSLKVTGQCKLAPIPVFYSDEENTFNGYTVH
jgi:hypothetical protein